MTTSQPASASMRLISFSVASRMIRNSFFRTEERICCNLGSSEYRPIRIIASPQRTLQQGRSNIGESRNDHTFSTTFSSKTVEKTRSFLIDVVVPRKVHKSL